LKNHKLQAIDIAKTYNSRRVVDGLSFEIYSGEIVALLGPNGAGKTTSFDMVVGLVKPDSGSIKLDGKDITKLKIHHRAALGLGYLTQEPSAFRQMSVWDNLSAVLEIREVKPSEIQIKVKNILEEFGIFHLKNSLAISLSGGERRRLEIYIIR
jgi:lipopolysaccharide export system ATP-binding protein